MGRKGTGRLWKCKEEERKQKRWRRIDRRENRNLKRGTKEAGKRPRDSIKTGEKKEGDKRGVRSKIGK